LPEVVEELHRANLSALCFSGGGIRSATFCLGVVAESRACGLARQVRLSLHCSGGRLRRRMARGVDALEQGRPPGVIAELSSARESKLEPEPDPIFYLRNFSNY